MCRVVIEAVGALRSHLEGGKHTERAGQPVDNAGFAIGSYQISMQLSVMQRITKHGVSWLT